MPRFYPSLFLSLSILSASPAHGIFDSWKSLRETIRNGSAADLEKLLLAKTSTINKLDTDTQLTPLHLAIQKGDMDKIELLLRYGANPNNSVPVMRVLKGDDKKFRLNPILMALENDNLRLLELLAKYVKPMPSSIDGIPLYSFAMQTKARTATLLFLGSQGVEFVEPREPWSNAAYSGLRDHSVEAVKTLLELGMPRSWLSKLDEGKGYTPLQMALARHKDEAIEFLLSESVAPDRISRSGAFDLGEFNIGLSSAALLAIESNSARNIELLAKHGFSFDGSIENLSLLSFAIAKGASHAVFDALIKAGAPLEMGGELPSPLLMAARTKQDPYYLETLIAAGADLTVKDKKGLTAYELAKASGYSPALLAQLRGKALEGAAQGKQEEDTLLEVGSKVYPANYGAGYGIVKGYNADTGEYTIEGSNDKEYSRYKRSEIGTVNGSLGGFKAGDKVIATKYKSGYAVIIAILPELNKVIVQQQGSISYDRLSLRDLTRYAD